MGQYSDGMDHIELAQSLLTDIPQNNSEYDLERKTACLYLIPCLKYLDSCYEIKWNVMRAIVMPVGLTVVLGVYLVFSSFPLPYYDMEWPWNEKTEKTEKPIITLLQLSHSTDLATTSGDLSIFDSILSSMIQPQLQAILSSLKATLERIRRSSFSFLDFIKHLVSVLCSILWILIVWGKLILVYKFIQSFWKKPCYLIVKGIEYYHLDYTFNLMAIRTLLYHLVVTKSFFQTKAAARYMFDPRYKYGGDGMPHSVFIDSLTDDLFAIFSRL